MNYCFSLYCHANNPAMSINRVPETIGSDNLILFIRTSPMSGRRRNIQSNIGASRLQDSTGWPIRRRTVISQYHPIYSQRD
ncbi:hypothetical protein DdX_00271 [Ditylenchus destructor]|uniref:Uncharacterized protein n=1 Tax=Ditylenchus destructor TaxID=166010 RepID=A0AAD4NH32_9BILA|nr:hypothetical protein DdX_00271 [Ditylenchus destructor]